MPSKIVFLRPRNWSRLKPYYYQQLTYGVVSEGFFAESLRKFCGKFAENYVLLRQERARKFCGKFAEIRGNLRKIFCNDPFPNDPISELSILKHYYRRQGVACISYLFLFSGLPEIPS